ncbi:DUF4912 domain-containing protein [Methyloglobulus sp.]|uniref:DUF4912 domain-containing protein n=1 Tax=Methyloglobulus sp. TaxID=2518622 RepID=UPI0032B706E2
MIFSPSRPLSKPMLSSQEILEISQEISRSYSPVATAKLAQPTIPEFRLSPTEMLQISEEISRKYALQSFADSPQLVLLPVDPHHLYAYWSPDQKNTTSVSKDDSHEIVLRIYPQPDENTKTPPIHSWFDVVIDNSQTQQKVPLPAQVNANAYSATIGKRYPDDHLAAFSTSKVVHVPRSSRASYQCREGVRLSGTLPPALFSNQEKPYSTNKNVSGQAN